MSSWEEDNSWKVDAILEHQMEYWNDVENDIWRMYDGSRIAIKDMDTSHIESCIRLINNSNGNWRREYLPALQNELTKRRWESRFKL